MQKPGNKFLTIAEPAGRDRAEVIYPSGIQVNQERGTFNWLAERGNEYEPLPAGYGRYALLGACKYLEIDEAGWEYCGVYEDRPEVCRNFETASSKCQVLRIMHAVDPPPTT
jgi:Fe-S-cluster containining protein